MTHLEVSLPVEIRPLRTEDLDELDWGAIDPEFIRRTLAERGDEVVFLLAVANEQAVGRLGIDFGRKAEARIVHLWAFGVVPALQRRGIGTALLQEAETLVAADPRGATLLEIGADEWNHDAAKLYRRLGYRDAGSERGSNDEVIVLLRRPVGEASRATRRYGAQRAPR